MKRFRIWLLIVLSGMIASCQNLPGGDDGLISTFLAETVYAGITETVAAYTATNTQTAQPGITPSVAPTTIIIATGAPAATATSAVSYSSYVYYTSTYTFTPTATGYTSTPTSTITTTPESVYYMCSDPERSKLQGEGCESFCSYYAASLEADGLNCYSYGTRILAPTAVPTAVPTEIPTEIPTDIPVEVPTEEATVAAAE